jgi:hypothetical protein
VIAGLGAALLAAGALLRASIERRKLAGLSTWRARIRPTTSSNR